MFSRPARRTLQLVIAVLAALVFCGVDWGLPTTAAVAQLFSPHSQWSAAQLAELENFSPRRFESDDTGNRPATGADVDRDPADLSRGPVQINLIDAQRAEIVRRYMLYSHQPDEMITFMSLAQMKPSSFDLDPHLYQYGGLWVYPVGGLLKLASLAGWVDLRADRTFYYDHPSAFGRFYVVARLYTLAWFIVLLATTAGLTRDLTGDDWAGVTAAVVVGLCPVVFAMAHEAKPHLPSSAMMLLAISAAGRWVRSGRTRHALMAGGACGLATGTVLSAGVIVIILPVMVMFRRVGFAQKVAVLAVALLLAAVAYFATNPYVAFHLLFDRDQLASNLGNSAAMYPVSRDVVSSFGTAAERLLQAASPAVVVMTGVAMLLVLVRAVKSRPARPGPIAWLIAIPAGIVLIQFTLLAAGKPAEYARFALFAVVAFAITSTWTLSLIGRSWIRGIYTVGLVAAVGYFTWPYFAAFLTDAQEQQGTRAVAAAHLSDKNLPTGATVQIFADPAPYSLPPISLWRWNLVLCPPGTPLTGDIIIRPVDLAPTNAAPDGYTREIITGNHRPAPITWADKPFEILTRDEPATEPHR